MKGQEAVGCRDLEKEAPRREAGSTERGGGNVETFAGMPRVAWGWRTRIRELTLFFFFIAGIAFPASCLFRVSLVHKDPTKRRLSSLHLPPPLPFLIQTRLSLAALIKVRGHCLPWMLDRYYAWGRVRWVAGGS